MPLSPPARSALAEWLTLRDAAEDAARMEKGAVPSKYLFPSRGASGHLTRHRFYGLIKEFAVAAGVSPGKVTPHLLGAADGASLLVVGSRGRGGFRGLLLGSVSQRCLESKQGSCRTVSLGGFRVKMVDLPASTPDVRCGLESNPARGGVHQRVAEKTTG